MAPLHRILQVIQASIHHLSESTCKNQYFVWAISSGLLLPLQLSHLNTLTAKFELDWLFLDGGPGRYCWRTQDYSQDTETDLLKKTFPDQGQSGKRWRTATGFHQRGSAPVRFRTCWECQDNCSARTDSILLCGFDTVLWRRNSKSVTVRWRQLGRLCSIMITLCFSTQTAPYNSHRRHCTADREPYSSLSTPVRD